MDFAARYGTAQRDLALVDADYFPVAAPRSAFNAYLLSFLKRIRAENRNAESGHRNLSFPPKLLSKGSGLSEGLRGASEDKGAQVYPALFRVSETSFGL